MSKLGLAQRILHVRGRFFAFAHFWLGESYLADQSFLGSDALVSARQLAVSNRPERGFDFRLLHRIAAFNVQHRMCISPRKG
jgi:hypothetical protein